MPLLSWKGYTFRTSASEAKILRYRYWVLPQQPKSTRHLSISPMRLRGHLPLLSLLIPKLRHPRHSVNVLLDQSRARCVELPPLIHVPGLSTAVLGEEFPDRLVQPKASKRVVFEEEIRESGPHRVGTPLHLQGSSGILADSKLDGIGPRPVPTGGGFIVHSQQDVDDDFQRLRLGV